MAELKEDVLVEFQARLSKISAFLESTLPKEPLGAETEEQRKECITLVEGMNNSLNNMRKNNQKEGKLLNAGLSVSNQSLNDTSELKSGVREERIPRSGSLPEISQSDNLEDWQATRTTKASYLYNKHGTLDEELNLKDLCELVIYHPFEEEEDESDSTDDDNRNNLALTSSNQLNISNHSPVNKRKSRKRDSAALFDISLEDLCEPDFAGYLKEKHGEKVWWCVLIDQHLCIFPSRDPNEVAYDVIIMPCCQISLDDRLMRTPVFRLTQSDMAPWVFVASNNDELKEWMKVLTVAVSAGKDSSTQACKTEEKSPSVCHKAPAMQAIVEEEEEEEIEGQLISCSVKSDASPASTQLQYNSSGLNESEESVAVSYVNGETVENGYPLKELPKLPDHEFGELPKIPDEVDSGEQFGGEVYEAVVELQLKGQAGHGEHEYHDDGFATDEFDSGSSDGEVSPNPQAQPVQQKGKKKKQFFHWLKKKAKKDKLFSSPQDGVSLAGYAYKGNDSVKRWFLIREEKLYCYKTIKDDDPEMTVELKGSEIKAVEDEKSKLAVQVIRDGVSQFTLVAKNAKDWERWKKAFLIESGFIKLVASPTESSSGVFEQEEEDDYVCPVISPELQKKFSTATEKPVIAVQTVDSVQSANSSKDNDGYTEVGSTIHVTNYKPPSPSASHQELGPLPPIPPELPVSWKTLDEEDKKDENDNAKKSWADEDIYEEVASSVAHADKVIKWDGVNTAKPDGTPTSPTSPMTPTSPTDNGQLKVADKASKGPMAAGIADGTIEDSAMTASSFMDNTSKPHLGRLNSSSGVWCPNISDKQQYLQIDLGEVIKVCGVASQGRPGFTDQGGWFVKTYTLAYSKDGENWGNYKEYGLAKVFQGNHDSETVVTNMLKMAVSAHYVRIKPQSWHNHIAMRVEIYKGEAGSKLTKGIHKLADNITKAAKGKSSDKQAISLTSTTEILSEADNSAAVTSMERKGSTDGQVSYVDRPSSSVENLSNKDDESKKDELEVGVENDGALSDYVHQADGYLVLREVTVEEKEVELKVQQKIQALKKGGEPIGKKEVSQGIMAKKSLYENNNQSEEKSEVRISSASNTKKENGLIEKKEVVVEKKDVETEKPDAKNADKGRNRKESQSYDREREELEKTEMIFQEYAKQLKKDGNSKEKKPSLVALNRLNFEDPEAVSKTKESVSHLTKSENLQKEKEELFKKLDNLKRRVSVAKDRKIFFSLSTSRSKATADADAEFHQSQCELARTKKRLSEIESEAKNLKVMELRNQKTQDKNAPVNPSKPLIRKNSKECKLGSADVQGAKVDCKANSSPESERTQKGSVLSQIKAFEQMKKTSEK